MAGIGNIANIASNMTIIQPKGDKTVKSAVNHEKKEKVNSCTKDAVRDIKAGLNSDDMKARKANLKLADTNATKRHVLKGIGIALAVIGGALLAAGLTVATGGLATAAIATGGCLIAGGAATFLGAHIGLKCPRVKDIGQQNSLLTNTNVQNMPDMQQKILDMRVNLNHFA